MSKGKRSIVVSIAGQKISVRTDAAESYVRQLAEHVDTQVKEQLAGSRMPTFGMAVLAALAIADDLFRERAERRSLRRRVRERAERMVRILDAAAEAK